MQQKTGASIKQCIENAWSSLGLPVEKLVENSCFVMDQGANFKVALSNFTCQPCMCMSCDWSYYKTHIPVRQIK